jgi:hypothetical protein
MIQRLSSFPTGSIRQDIRLCAEFRPHQELSVPEDEVVEVRLGRLLLGFTPTASVCQLHFVSVEGFTQRSVPIPCPSAIA